MKIAAFLVAVAVLIFAAPSVRAATRKAKRAALNVDAMLDAIAAVESGNNPRAVGRLGERGRCQLREGTWRQYTNAPFILWASVDCPLTRKVERRHLSAICAALFRDGFDADPILIAAAWRFGIHAAVRHVRADSARRTANLYWDAISHQEARK